MMTGESFLVLSANPHRRAYVADALRASGAVSVEAVSLQRAQAILRQLRFDVLAIDFIGLDSEVVGFLEELRVRNPETRVVIINPPGDRRVLAILQASNLTKCFGGAGSCGITSAVNDAIPHSGEINGIRRDSERGRHAGRNGKNGRQT